MGYTKLDATLVTSSMWSEDDRTLRVWVYLMARAGANGAVYDTIPAIARACAYDIPTVQAILEKLSSPDPFSRTPDLDGRRIAILTEPEFSIHLVNHSKYREKDHTHAERQRRYRKAKRDGKSDGGDASRPSRVTSRDASRRQKQKHKTENERIPEAPAAPSSDWNRQAADVYLEHYPKGSVPGAMYRSLRPLVERHGWGSVAPQLAAYLERVPVDFHNWPKFAAGFGRWNEAPQIRGKPATAENERVLDEWERKVREGVA